MELIYPLITCICITNNRAAMLKKAIDYFKVQDYPNKELLISYPINDESSKQIIDQTTDLHKTRIVKMERADDLTLGNARNQAINEAKGDYICNWDDDDWYHPSRLSYQLYHLQKSGDNFDACVLKQLLLYDQTTQKAYLSFLYPWENTLLCKKEAFNKDPYADKNIGEDSDIIDFLDGNKKLYHLGDAPFLYIYIYHRNNTWGYRHFKSFIRRSELLTDEQAQNIVKLLE